MDHQIDFSKMEWITPAIGVKYKTFINATQRIRLVVFSEGFVEPDWCLHGHSGLVLDGACRINFNGSIEYLQKGDVFHIETGKNDKHMVIMGKDEWIQILLFEQLI